jgi:hypothetical protein
MKVTEPSDNVTIHVKDMTIHEKDVTIQVAMFIDTAP